MKIFDEIWNQHYYTIYYTVIRKKRQISSIHRDGINSMNTQTRHSHFQNIQINRMQWQQINDYIAIFSILIQSNIESINWNGYDWTIKFNLYSCLNTINEWIVI